MLSKDKARGAILGYYVLYRVKQNTPTWINKTVDGAGATSLLVGPLNEHTTYEFAMQAFNSKGISDVSALVEKTTDQHSECYFIFYLFIIFSLLYYGYSYLLCYDCYCLHDLRQSSFAVRPSVSCELFLMDCSQSLDLVVKIFFRYGTYVESKL